MGKKALLEIINILGRVRVNTVDEHGSIPSDQNHSQLLEQVSQHLLLLPRAPGQSSRRLQGLERDEG